MARMLPVALLLASLPFGGGAHAQDPWVVGRALFDTAFDPRSNFAGDIREGTDDEILLTAALSERDDIAPGTGLAVAYRCLPIDAKSCRPSFTARILRVKADAEGGRFEGSMAMLARLAKARSRAERRAAFAASGLEWLEADLLACDGGLEALDAVRKADWNPDLHFRLRADGGDLILHPAMIRVTMRGDYVTSSYRGWVLADGVPAAVRALIGTLDKCWKPAASPPPWERVD